MGTEETGASLGGGSDIATSASAMLQSVLEQNNPLKGQSPITFGGSVSAPPPQPQFKPPEATYPNRPGGYNTTGERKRDEKQALFHTIAGLVKSGVDYTQQKKQRAIQMDIERLLEASKGREEAQRMLQEDPNNQDAKAAMIKNTNIINDITGDPKKVKSLQKAFNINLMGDNKNPLETGALVKAFKDFGQGGSKRDSGELSPVAQRFQGQQPQTAQENPALKVISQLVKDKVMAGAKEQMDAFVNLTKALGTEKTKEEELKLRGDLATKIANLKSQQLQNQYLAYIARTKGIVEATNIKARAEIKRAQIAAGAQEKIWNQRLQTMEAIADANNKTKIDIQDKKDLTATDIAKLKQKNVLQGKAIAQLNTEYKDGLNVVKDIHNEINKRNTLIEGLSKSEWTKWFNSGKIASYNAEINTLKGRLAQAQGHLSGIDQRRQMLQKALDIPDAAPIDTSSSGDSGVGTGNEDSHIEVNTDDLKGLGDIPQDKDTDTNTDSSNTAANTGAQ